MFGTLGCGDSLGTDAPDVGADTLAGSDTAGASDADVGSDVGTCLVDVPASTGTILTDRGAVTGAHGGKSWSYKNIPYAAPPVGPLRWKPPQPAACWKGARDGTAWGALCPQSDAAGTAPVTGTEDCLQLNVWVPDGAKGPLPIMVFIHGGGHQVGSAVELTAGVRIYDGASIAESGNVAVVTLNYRLGPLGFLAHPLLDAEDAHESSGNYGGLDQVAALAWVQRNAAAIGGDPSKVTIFGESAGGVAVCALLASPLAKGLFSAAILESGGCVAKKQADAEALGAKVVTAAKCDGAADVLACLRALPAAGVVTAYPLPVDVAGLSPGYDAVVDGYFLGGAPLDVIAAGGHNHVPTILGTNADETSKTVPLPTTAVDADYQKAVVALVGPTLSDKVLAQYPSTDYATPWNAYVALTTDAKFVCPTRRNLGALRDGQDEPVYRYQFAHPLDNAPKQKIYGAWHGVELLYLFDDLTIAGYAPSDAEKAIGAAMRGYWSSFAATGTPSLATKWPEWDEKDTFLRFDSTIATAVSLRSKQCDFWDTLVK